MVGVFVRVGDLRDKNADRYVIRDLPCALQTAGAPLNRLPVTVGKGW